MAWTSPRTWVTGETVTAALLNTHVRDNLNALMVVTTKGDLAVATGSTALTRLAVGTNGDVLVADSAASMGVRWSSTGKTASAGSGKLINISGTITAAANNDVLYGLNMLPLFAKSTFTGLSIYNTVMDGGNMTASGSGTIATATTLYISAPIIGTANRALYVATGNAIFAGDTAAIVFVGDTANANMTTGLTINNGAATDEAFAIKQSSVAHGITTYAETDTYFNIETASPGGAYLSGFTGGAQVAAMIIRGLTSTASGTRSTAASGAVAILGALKSGTSIATLGADKNIMVIQDDTTTRFIFDSDGSAHADVEWIAFDAYDDLDLLAGLEAEFSVRRRDAVRNTFGRWLTERRKALQANKIVNFYDRDGRRAMVNFTRLAMLQTGALRQMGMRMKAQDARLLQLENKLLQLGA